MDLLITGGTGLVGSQFTSGLKVSSKDCDLRDPIATNLLFENNKSIKKVIHTAARVGGIGGNMNYKGEFFYDNIMMNTNVIEACRTHGVEKLIVFLSTCIFPDKVEYPLTEDKVHLGPPHSSNDAYAYAKRMADVQIKAYREQYGVEYASIIPTNIYGPNDNFSLSNGHVIPSLIHKFFIARESKKDLMIWGTGAPLREFVFSKDVATITQWILDNASLDSVIVSSGEEVKIKELVDLVASLMNYKGNIIYDSTKPDGQYRKPTDITKLKSVLPDYRFVSLEEGLKETVNWFESNYPKIRL
jgi:GDP-L-fucose synthase